MNTSLVQVSNGQLSDVQLSTIGFLARYGGQTRENYEVTLKIFFDWCTRNNLHVFENMKRPILEIFARYLEEDRKNIPSTVAHHLSIIRVFYKFAEIDEYIVKSPATNIRMPRVYMDESKTLGLDRMELGSLIQTARSSHPSDNALVTLLGLLGLRVSEACNVRIEDFQDTERGHRVLRVIGKGKKPATIPLPIPVLRALETAAEGRTTGHLLLRRTSIVPMNRKAATLAITRLCKKAGINKHITPHGLRHSFVTACLDAGVPLRDVQIAARHSDPRVTSRYDRARHNLDRHANYVVAAFLAGSA